MSQGELHALALSLFLPRATAPDSPFRFVVLNDPIQAMDPAKVQGFVQVLLELAADRQVIVLSHDERLPAAVLARQALEQIVDSRCDAKGRGLDRASMRSKLIILAAEAGADVGSRGENTWAGLSQASHHHAYELQPTAGEVRDVIRLTTSLGP